MVVSRLFPKILPIFPGVGFELIEMLTLIQQDLHDPKKILPSTELEAVGLAFFLLKIPYIA